jgi:hypothetical protein
VEDIEKIVPEYYNGVIKHQTVTPAGACGILVV